MTATWGTIGQNGTGPRKTPVILPLRENNSRTISDRGAISSPTDNLGELDGGARFSFPEMLHKPAPPPAPLTPTAVWPPCERLATVRACAETAETICRRLPTNSSAILLLTSPGDGDGKTSLAISLAPELAKRMNSVLVVDADFRKADLSSRLVLSDGGASAGSAALIYPTDRLGLSVLPIASECAAAASLKKKRELPVAGALRLDHDLFEDLRHPKSSSQTPPQHPALWDREWFEDLRDRWPLVLLDAPSLEHAEPAPILRYCDGAYLVVRLGHTSRRALAEAGRAIEARGGKLLGTVVVGNT